MFHWLDTVRNGLAGFASSSRRTRQAHKRSHGRHFAASASSRYSHHALVEPLEQRQLLSVRLDLVADVNKEPSAWEGAPVELGNMLLLSARDVAHGEELWAYDKTTGVASLVKDVRPGPQSSYLTQLVNANGTVYFVANDGVHGWELWKSDGTSAGTGLVKDIHLGADSEIYGGLTAIGGTVYFTANDGVNGHELWKSDGTSSGTVLVKDIQPGAGSSGTGAAIKLAVGGTLYFRANDGVSGVELWSSNGTSSGTNLVRDIRPGGSSAPYYFTNVSGTLFFTANDGSHRELWKSNGTSTGTGLVRATTGTYGYIEPHELVNVSGTLYFVADGGSGGELWRSDGTCSGTILVRDIYEGVTDPYDPSSFPNSSNPNQLTNVNGTLFFSANDGGEGQELWKSNGTFSGTVLVRDIRPGAASAIVPSYGYGKFINVGSTLYFMANEGLGGQEIWRSDGTSSGTVRVLDVVPGPASSGVLNLWTFGGTPYFVSNNSGDGFALWKLSGSTPTLAVDNAGVSTKGSFSDTATEFNGLLYYDVRHYDADQIERHALWKSDGTSGGTLLVKDGFTPGPKVQVGLRSLTNVNGTLFFVANDDELWRTDGTSAGTVLVASFQAPSGAANAPQWLTNVGGILYFGANDGVSGMELWRSDGTASGTALIKDIRPGAGSSLSFSEFVAVGGTLFFRANNGVNGFELWRSDGTCSGTVLVRDIRPASGDSIPNGLVNVNGTLMFAANDGVNGAELWRSDGSSTGTWLVRDVQPGASGSGQNSSNMGGLNSGGILYFWANDGASGTELWRSDGTSSGSVLVKDIQPGSGGSFPFALTAYDGSVFFSADDGAGYRSLWRTDGTNSGTVMVHHVGLTTAGNGIDGMRVAGGKLYFYLIAAQTPVAGSPVWISDGTSAGTAPITASQPEPVGSGGLNNPFRAISVGNEYYLQLGGSRYGIEFWKVVQTDTAITASGTGGYRGESRNFTFTTADASTTAGFRYDIDWDNNGTIDQTFNSTSSSQVVPHVSYTSGTQTLRITITDLDDNSTGSATLLVQTAEFVLRPNVDNPTLTDLIWGGSAGDDSVVFTQTGASAVSVQKLLDNGVVMNVTQAVSGVTGRVIAYGNPGNDTLDASGLSTKSATLDGGAGNNTLRGGNGGDILIGGTDGAEGGPSGQRDGSNVIIAGNGTNTIYGNAPVGKKEQTGGDNIIIGGTGSDTIYGNYGVNNQPLADGGEGGHNILIGGAGADTIYTTQSADGGEGSHGSIAIAGSTTYGNSPSGIAALQSILAEWSSGHATAAKVAFIQGTGGPGGLNGTNYLTEGGTVLSDAAVDTIFGDTNGSAHWFFYRLSEDLLNRTKTDDILTPLP